MMKKYIRDVISKVRGNNFDREYSEIKTITDKDELLKFQKRHLESLLLHAYKNVPYYRRVFENVGVINDGIVDLSRFDKIPILTKEIMRKYHKELISKDYTTRKWYCNSTGASTGEPTRFMQDSIYTLWGNAAFYYYYKDILGIDESCAKKIILWGSERDLLQGSIGLEAKISNWLNNTVFLNSFRMDDEDIKYYIKIINSYKPDLIRGYASSLYELCRYAERKDIKVYAPKIVVSSAETLNDEMRRKIEKVFGRKLYNFYGSRETNNIAGECRAGLMHVLAFHNYVEVLNNHNRVVKEGEEGRVIVTNFHNYSMPFIRCDIGDIAVLGPSRCKCDNPLPTIRSIVGRSSEALLTISEKIISPCFVPFLFYPDCTDSASGIEQYQKIRQFQVIQKRKDELIIKIIKESETDERGFDYILTNFKKYLGSDMKIEMCFVDSITPLPSGKRTYVISNIHKTREGANIG